MATKPTVDSPVRGMVANSGGGYTVFSLDAVLPGRPESIPVAERDAGKLQLAQEAGVSDYLAFVQALYDRDLVPVIRIAIVIGFVAILYFGGLLTLNGTLEVGAYSILIFMTQRLLWPLTSLGRDWRCGRSSRYSV